MFVVLFFFFFFQAEDGIRDLTVTGVQTCALPIWCLAQPGPGGRTGPGHGGAAAAGGAGAAVRARAVSAVAGGCHRRGRGCADRERTRLESRHKQKSYAVFFFEKKKKKERKVVSLCMRL